MPKSKERLAAARRLENVFRPDQMKRAHERQVIQFAIVLLKRNEQSDAIAYELGMLAIEEHKANRTSRRDILEYASTLLMVPP